MTSKNIFDHSGSTFDSFLEQEGFLAQTEALALKRVLAWQLKRAMAANKISKNAMARRLRTSRSQVNRLLDPLNVGVSLGTIARAAKAVGKRVSVQILDTESSEARNPVPHGRVRGMHRSAMKVQKRERKSLQKAG
jgi:antitoxin HicB